MRFIWEPVASPKSQKSKALHNRQVCLCSEWLAGWPGDLGINTPSESFADSQAHWWYRLLLNSILKILTQLILFDPPTWLYCELWSRVGIWTSSVPCEGKEGSERLLLVWDNYFWDSAASIKTSVNLRRQKEIKENIHHRFLKYVHSKDRCFYHQEKLLKILEFMSCRWIFQSIRFYKGSAMPTIGKQTNKQKRSAQLCSNQAFTSSSFYILLKKKNPLNPMLQRCALKKIRHLRFFGEETEACSFSA